MSLKRDAENEREGCVLLKERDDILTYSIFIFYYNTCKTDAFFFCSLGGGDGGFGFVMGIVFTSGTIGAFVGVGGAFVGSGVGLGLGVSSSLLLYCHRPSPAGGRSRLPYWWVRSSHLRHGRNKERLIIIAANLGHGNFKWLMEFYAQREGSAKRGFCRGLFVHIRLPCRCNEKSTKREETEAEALFKTTQEQENTQSINAQSGDNKTVLGNVKS